ncbi:ubiquitin-like small modifier protein 1 [Palaeococcus ferrophilus]|uniref:ubiquitin-like small modifier protein 1 n=1 Tax=Palaeococcus ferrophilus TaxID=83868 RepID=UPI00064EFC6A|nr:ubiquitin-like small modifier protein 1 [Palaeococcus ferrophilus]
MRVRVRYFARFRSIAGRDEEEFELPAGSTVRDLLKLIVDRHPAFRGESFGEDYDDEADVNVSRNGRYVGFDEVLEEGDVVAIFPPVSGG